MMRFFFYGTLLDHDVMALVIGRRLPPAAFVPATLKGHVRRRAKGVSYPILVRKPGGEVEGMVVGGLTRRDVERLSAYEGPRYRIAPLKVRVGRSLTTVSVFEPVEKRFQPVDGAWDIALWQGRHKRPFVARLRRALSAQAPS
jgi:CBS domain-containing protein